MQFSRLKALFKDGHRDCFMAKGEPRRLVAVRICSILSTSLSWVFQRTLRHFLCQEQKSMPHSQREACSCHSNLALFFTGVNVARPLLLIPAARLIHSRGSVRVVLRVVGSPSSLCTWVGEVLVVVPGISVFLDLAPIFIEYVAVDLLKYARVLGPCGDRGNTPRWRSMPPVVRRTSDILLWSLCSDSPWS